MTSHVLNQHFGLNKACIFTSAGQKVAKEKRKSKSSKGESDNTAIQEMPTLQGTASDSREVLVSESKVRHHGKGQSL